MLWLSTTEKRFHNCTVLVMIWRTVPSLSVEEQNKKGVFFCPEENFSMLIATIILPRTWLWTNICECNSCWNHLRGRWQNRPLQLSFQKGRIVIKQAIYTLGFLILISPYFRSNRLQSKGGWRRGLFFKSKIGHSSPPPPKKAIVNHFSLP